MNALSDSATRLVAAAGYYRCHRDAHIGHTVQRRSCQYGNELYGTLHGKNWSLTDCFSFVVIEQRRLTQALATDHRFRRAGFEAVLLNEPPA